jgi:2-iminobutanoate/2-iminopropanoate deaminase
MIRYINGVPGAPTAIGPYSQATIFDNLVYVSGQIPVHPETGLLVEDGIEAQTEQVMRNLIAVLGFMNIDFTHVLKATIFLTDLSTFDKVNNVYGRWMGDVRPARACVQVSALPKGADVEIELVAVLSEREIVTVPHGAVDDGMELGQELS